MLLYHRHTEYARVVEVVTVTEEGTFVADDLPEGYAGASMDVEVVHAVYMTDSSGSMYVYNFSNPKPLNKDKAPSTGAIFLDGEQKKGGSGKARTWTMRMNTELPDYVRERARAVHFIMDGDGEEGTAL